MWRHGFAKKLQLEAGMVVNVTNVRTVPLYRGMGKVVPGYARQDELTGDLVVKRKREASLEEKATTEPM